MRKLHTLILSGSLVPCKKTPRCILTKIERLHVPIVHNKQQIKAENKISLNYLHYDNKCTIEYIAFYIKQKFLQHINIDELFDNDSQIYKTYNSLTKLDKIKVVNNQYLADQNISGLRKLSHSLNAVLCD